MRRAGLVLVVVLLATTIAPSGLGAAPPIRAGSTNYELVIESAGGGATPLARAGVLPSDEAIFVAPSQGIVQVRYYLDPSARNLELRSLGGRPARSPRPPRSPWRDGGRWVRKRRPPGRIPWSPQSIWPTGERC